MGSNYLFKRSFTVFLALILIMPSLMTGFVRPLSVGAEELASPWTTISTGGNEVNELWVEDNKNYARLGTGAGNDNGSNAAIFQEDAVAKEVGVMEYTFIPETEGKTTRFGFYPHYEDANNFVFVGYDLDGWFYEYKHEGSGEWLQKRPNVALPEPGTEYAIKIDYSGTTLNVVLDGEDLFGQVELGDKAENLINAPEAIKLGAFNKENSQVLIELGDVVEGPVDPEEPEVPIDPEEPEVPIDPEEPEVPVDPEEPETPVDPETPPVAGDPVDVENDNLKEGDFNIIEGAGSLTYNEDGSVIFGATPSGRNKIVYNTEGIKNGIFEADITPDRDLTRFGMIYRVQDPSVYSYVGAGDQSKHYFGEVFNPANTYTGMTTSVPLEKDQTYRLRLKVNGDLATLYIDDEIVNSWSMPNGVDKAGLLGFEKSRGAANVKISNIKIKETVTPVSPETPSEADTLSSTYMDVMIDKVFPRIMEYKVDDKVMLGQESSVYGLKVNGLLYYPKVSYEKVSKSEALYTLTVVDEEEKIDAVFKVSLKVVDNEVIYRFEEINNKAGAKIATVEFANMNLISVNSNQAGASAKLVRVSSDVNKPGDEDVIVDASLGNIGTSNNYYAGFLSNDELSAGVWSSSEVDGHGNLVASRYEGEDGVKAMGIASNVLYYHREFMTEPTGDKPSIKIAIAEDLNKDKEIDWQDGAIAYRNIMQNIEGSEDVNNKVGTRIVMNFGSQAQQPFLKTLDNVKKVALATDGLKQPVLLKGYGNEGHDSAHPDYGEVGERMGGAIDMNTLIDEGHKYNAEFGVHINAQETYPEAKSFNEDFINGPNSKGWGWLDQSYTIDKLKDLYSGTRAVRLDELEAASPDLDFVYLDVWYQDQWESNRISEQFIDRGWRVTTEFGTSVMNHSTWQHWATDRNYGGSTNKGINSEALRFISNHQKDSWVLNWPEAGGTADHPLLGGFELAGFEGWQSDKNFDNYIHMTFDTNLPTKFLQKYYVNKWTTVEGDKEKTNLEKEIELTDPSNGDVVVVTRKDDSRERIITLNGNVVLDEHAYLLPWVEQDFKTPTPKSDEMYHWNLEGGTTTWTLPKEFAGVSSVYAYELTDQGRTDMKEIKVTNNQVTLNADAATPYIVVAGEDEGLQIDNWGDSAHVYDTGFSSGTIEDEATIVEGDTEAVSVIRTNQVGSARNLSNGDYYLNMESPTESTKVTRTITDLEPGKDYVAEVYVENNSDVKALIDVTGGVEDVSNSTLRSLQKNYVKADSHASNNGYNSKMQRMQVSFTAASTTAKLSFIREAGEGNTKFDDIRVVQKTLTNEVSPRVFEQDFESVVQGIYPFVIGNTENVEDNRIHLAELNDPYTQKGWAGKKLVDDVLGGNWSVKVNTGNNGLLYRTIPQHFQFEPGVNYKVSFDYQTTSTAHRFISGDEEIDVRTITAATGLSENELLSAATDTETAEFTVTGSENGQTYIGIFSDGTALDGDTGAGTFMLDNLRIESLAPGLKVQDTTISLGEELDLQSLITFAEDSEGNDVTSSVIIDKGDFDANKLGTYAITFTLKEDNFADIVLIASVTVKENLNVTELEKLIKTASKISNDDGKYTKASYETLKTAITEAEAALAKVETEEELTAAVSALQAAIDGLVLSEPDPEENPNTTVLLKLIKKASAISNADGKYTKSSYEALKTAITEAEKALNKIKTEEELTAAVSALQAAIDGLVLSEPDPEEDLNTTVLLKLIKKASAISNADGKYTKSSYEALKTAITEAEKALNKIKTEEELTAAASALQAAIDGLVLSEPDPEENPNTTELEELIKTASAISNDDGKYTKASYETLQTAIEEAEAKLAKGETEEELAAAVTALKEAIDGLVLSESDPEKNLNTTVLEDLIKAASAISNDDGKYTKASYETLQTAIEEAEATLAKGETEEELATAVATLQAAIDGLVEKEQGGNNNNNGSNGNEGNNGSNGSSGSSGNNGNATVDGKPVTPGQNSSNNGKKLPSTATSMFNWMVIGFLLISIGMGAAFITRKRGKVKT